jgi:hypothetical protein
MGVDLVYTEARNFSCNQRLIRVSVDYLHLDRFHDLFIVRRAMSIPEVGELLRRAEVLRQEQV